MKRLYETRLLLYSIGLLVSSIVERIITNEINKYQQLNTILYHTLSLFILAFLFILTNVLLKRIVHSKFVTKIMQGKKYIGGRWIEIVYNEDKKIFGYSDVEISYDADNIRITGTNYDRDLKYMNGFTATIASMVDYDLSYVFIGKQDGKFWQGLGNLTFQKTSTIVLNRYSGYFFDENVKHRAEGIKIWKKDDLKQIDDNFVAGIKALLPEILVQIDGIS